MKKRFSVLIAGVLLGTMLAISGVTIGVAAPAAPIDHVLTQPDGSTFVARQWGDEWSNGFETALGYTILQEDSGWWVYADKAPDGSLVPFLVGEEALIVDSALPEGLPQHLRPDRVEDELLLLGRTATRSQNSGNHPTLVILARFSDRAGTYSAANFAATLFGTTNSVKDYYLKASHNLLTLTPVTESHGTANDGVIGWLNLSYNHPNTGGSTGLANQQIVKNALSEANPYIDYAAYDTNGDGFISKNELHILVVVAGYEHAYNQSTSPSVWAHNWDLNWAGVPTLDEVVLGDYYNNGGYSQVGEIHLDHPATIGIIAHELGHDISWPDLYDIDGTSDGVGDWSIMGSGNWNFTGSGYYGSSPALPDAFLKYYQGWITPTPVTGTLTGASIPQAATNATAFLLRPNPGGVDWDFYRSSGTGEYFLVENRQKTSYDAGLPGSGLLIWHIDESVTYTNSANANENQPLVKLMEADGLNHLSNPSDFNRGDAGDPFPGTSNNRTFNYSSTPNSRLYSGADSYVSVTSISNSGATMTADLSYIAEPAAPTGVTASKGSFTDRVQVTWTASSGATYYKVYRNTSNSHAGEMELTSSETNTFYNDFTATPGQTYYYWVIACNTAGCSTYSSPDSGYRAVTVPAAPTGVSATDGTYTDKVRITWTASSGATYYRVFSNFSDSHDGETELTSSYAASPYDDITAVSGYVTYYWVKACNAMGCSDYSASDSGYRALLPPTGLTASDGTYTDKVQISWNPSAGANYYYLYRNTSNSHTGEMLLATVGHVASFDDTTATPGQVYYYWVKTCSNYVPCSDYSTAESGYRAMSIPAAPHIFASDGLYLDFVEITWTFPAGATYYRVFRNTNNNHTGETELTGIPSTCPYNDTSAEPGQVYYYWMKACNSTGCSEYSTSDSGFRKIAAPTGVSASDDTFTDKVRVSWAASSGATFYEVYRHTSNDHNSATKLAGAHAGSPYDDTGATPGVTYYYWVKACNTAGCSGFSSSDTGRRAEVIPAAPTGVSASDDTYTDKVRVSWTASSGATSYEVYRHTSDNSAGASKLAGTPAGSPYDDTGATPGVTYYYWVKACNTGGCSGFSSPDTGRRAEVIPPAPTGVTASGGSYPDKVVLSWGEAVGATSYKVFRNSSDDHTGETELASSHPTTTYEDTTATPGETYTYWVKACNSAGCSEYSASVTGWRSTGFVIFLPIINK